MSFYNIAELEAFIEKQFEENYHALSVATGQSLAPEAKNTAKMQVILYWRKLHTLASSVVETEVRLTLPSQKTPKGRTFSIEGVVDLVRGDDGFQVMYDLKTMEADNVKSQIEKFRKQLNVYAFIWQKLRGKDLDDITIVATGFPDKLRQAINAGENEHKINHFMEKWNPLIEVGNDDSDVQSTIEDFAEVVDQIEDGEFTSPPVSVLKQKDPITKKTFATHKCRNCDARFSCPSYRMYAFQAGARAAKQMREYFARPDDDLYCDEKIISALDVQPIFQNFSEE